MRTMLASLAPLAGCLWLVPASGQLPDPLGDWRAYSPDTVRAAAPAEVRPGHVELLPLRLLPTLAAATYFEIETHLAVTRPGREPEAILLADGVFDLAGLARAVNDPGVFARIEDRIYLASRPIYLAPGATLLIRDAELRLSVPDLAALLYRGDLFVIDSIVTSWDPNKGDAAPRPPIPKAELLLHGRHPARPYLLGLRGSRSFVAASHLTGLGFNGSLAGFGLSLWARHDSHRNGAPSLRDLTNELPRPTGVFIGNTVSDCFFGFYTNNSGAVLLLGNVFRDNLVYNVDPHDYSGPLVIVRNLATGALYKHGIIISREVNGARIIENLAYGNAGTGIMLDRASADAQVRDNVVFANRGDGIASFESDRGVLVGNRVIANRNNGIHLRNSEGVQVAENSIEGNGGFGVEVASADLDDAPTRNLERDPYRQSGSATVSGNRIRGNLDAALAAKGAVRLSVRDNDFAGSGVHIFGGDLSPHGAELLRLNGGPGFHFPRLRAEPAP